MLVVIDTNVIVSALLTKRDPTAEVVARAERGDDIAHYNYDIIQEYELVLKRDKFKFDKDIIDATVNAILFQGKRVSGKPVDAQFSDESDRKFYEVAKSVGAYLVTGNLRHFPDDPLVVSPREFLDIIANPSNRAPAAPSK